MLKYTLGIPKEVNVTENLELEIFCFRNLFLISYYVITNMPWIENCWMRKHGKLVNKIACKIYTSVYISATYFQVNTLIKNKQTFICCKSVVFKENNWDVILIRWKFMKPVKFHMKTNASKYVRLIIVFS